MELLKDITENYSPETIPLMESISQAVKELKLLKKGGKVTNKMVKDFVKSNHNLTVAAALHALSSHKQYKANRRATFNLFAKTAYDKRMVKTIVDAMVKSKAFKLNKTKYAQGGKIWELEKVKGGF